MVDCFDLRYIVVTCEFSLRGESACIKRAFRSQGAPSYLEGITSLEMAKVVPAEDAEELGRALAAAQSEGL